MFILFSGSLLTEASGTTYRVLPGDSLWGLSRKFNVSVTNLQEWNQLNSSTIYVGQTLTIGKSDSVATTYKVKAGDSLWSIAKKYGTTVQNIKNLNQLTTDIIYVGQTLAVSGSTTSTPPVQSGASSSYIVKAGDTLSGIAKKFGTTVQSIKQVNGLTSDIIKVGQNLKIASSNSTSQTTSNWRI
ncbi:LysM peptidoglycan-binding domain-containing protein [Caldifermentibacillus hisashii]|uniref:LysM peptidoglycan-binding domain-containing protein n=1 Tax=Caldifermentibacillus hisashii TaxID=996558 RepID=UPI00310143A7